MAKAARRRANTIRLWRKYRKFSQEDLAEAIGMTGGNLSQIENGHINYTDESLSKLARVLECSKGDLLDVNPFELDDLDQLTRAPRAQLTDAQRKTIADLARIALNRPK